jgi:hypothetical protein
VQAVNAAFSLNRTPSLTLTTATNAASPNQTRYRRSRYAPLPAVQGFHDALGYFAGVEKLPRPVRTFASDAIVRLKPYAFSDPDGSVVVPARGYYPPRTPEDFTGRGAETSPPSANISTFETMLLDTDSADPSTFQVVSIGEAGGLDISGQQTGNPGDYGVQFGHHFRLLAQSPDGTSATLRIWNSSLASNLSSTTTASAAGDGVVTVNIEAQNVGSPARLTLYSDFDHRQATYADGSATNGAILVRASPGQVAAAFRNRGLAGVRELAASAGEATGIVWTSPGPLASGATASFSYQLKLQPGVASTSPTYQVIDQSSADQ